MMVASLVVSAWTSWSSICLPTASLSLILSFSNCCLIFLFVQICVSSTVLIKSPSVSSWRWRLITSSFLWNESIRLPISERNSASLLRNRFCVVVTSALRASSRSECNLRRIDFSSSNRFSIASAFLLLWSNSSFKEDNAYIKWSEPKIGVIPFWRQTLSWLKTNARFSASFFCFSEFAWATSCFSCCSISFSLISFTISSA